MSLRAQDGSFQLALPSALRTKVLQGRSSEIHLGIRPVHMDARPSSQDNNTNGNNALALTGQVYTYEDLGEEGQLAAHIGNETVLAVTSPDLAFAHGDTVSLQLRPDRIHLFDAKTESAL